MEKENLRHRNSSLEFLKIIAMVIIITSHFVVHGIMRNPIPVEESTWQFWIAYLLGGGGALGNYTFLLISGYFMIEKNVNYKRILLLFVELFFYSWLILFIFYMGEIEQINTKDIIKSLIPIWFGENWFVSCYIMCIFAVYQSVSERIE